MSGTFPAPTTPPQPTGLPAKALSFLSGVFTKNLPAKLAALVLALIVWFTVRQDLNATFETDRCVVNLDLPAGYVLLQDSPLSRLSVEFKGPRSAIGDVKKAPTVTLRVTEEDLAGQSEASITFSMERGNIRHDYGGDIEITSVAQAPFDLRVARMESARFRLLPPEVTGKPNDWQAKVVVGTPQVEVRGPRSSLDQVAEIQPKPIDVSAIFEQVTDVAPLGATPFPLYLPDRLEELFIELPPGTRLECVVSFPLAEKPETHAVPIEVRTRTPESPFILKLNPQDPLRKVDENGRERFVIDLVFRGAPSTLKKLRTAIDEGSVTAYVMAEDNEGYRGGTEGLTFIDAAYLRLEGMPNGVKYIPPAASIPVEVVPR